MQLLVDQRNTLTVGDIVPVGELFDVIAHGDEAFSQEMAIHFENAKRLYHQKVLPLLEKQHSVRREDLEMLPSQDPKRIAFRNHDRLVKTLLLSALVPEVESLRALNAERLAALNHGTVKTPIAGREGQEVLRLCKGWAASVGEIRIGEEANPTISIQLSGVDTESIIKQAEHEDNRGNRIRLLRQMIFEQLKIEGEDELEQYHNFFWKNTKRSCVVLFKNIRELPDSSLENTNAHWKLVIDFPFEEGHSPRDDLSRLDLFKESYPDGAKTICWVPAFLSAEAQKDLGTLVILEHILTGDRFSQYSNHLSPQDRQAAKSLLENQRSVLRQRVQNHIDAAYGLESLIPDSLDTTHTLELHERFVSLHPGFELQPPVAANLAGAMRNLLEQALELEFPAAPMFEADVSKIGNLEKVYQVISDAAQSHDGRVLVDRSLRSLMRQIANPLRLGEMGQDATHFVLDQYWKNHFTRKAAGGAIAVSQLRQWLDAPKPMGLPKEIQNLVILTFVEQTNRTFYRHNVLIEPTLKDVPNDCELREQKLPDESQWQQAVQRAGNIFQVEVSPLRKINNIATLESEVKKKASALGDASQKYVCILRDCLNKFGLSTETDRMKTATAASVLVEQICSGKPDIVMILASADIATTEAAMKDCLSKASALGSTLEQTSWEIFQSLGDLTDERRATADELGETVQQALCVAACNHRGSGLQTSQFLAQIKCDYRSRWAQIKCDWAQIKCNGRAIIRSDSH